MDGQRRRIGSRGAAGAVIAAAAAGVLAVAARLPVANALSAANGLPAGVVAPAMMLVLAAIDLVGAVVAKSWSVERTPWTFVVGAALFVLLFWVYGVSLRYGQLSTITIGWVVVVTVGSMVLDTVAYDVHQPARKWAAAAVIVALLVYLMVDDRTAVEPRSDHLHSHTAQSPR